VAAKTHPQLAHETDEVRRLRCELRIRPRRARGLLGPGLFPGSARPKDVLRSARARLRARDPEAVGLLGQASPRARRGLGPAVLRAFPQFGKRTARETAELGRRRVELFGMIGVAGLEGGEPAAEARQFIRRQLADSFGDFLDFHGTN